MNTNVKINFWNDLRHFISAELKSFGHPTPGAKELRQQDRKAEHLKNANPHYDSERLIEHYFSILMRRILPTNYQVYVSDIIQQDAQKRVLVETIKNKLATGQDINPHLSHLARSVNQVDNDNLDLLLSEWGIYHAHFEVGRTNELLFFYIKDQSAYLLDVLNHEDDQGTVETWTNTRLIEILHRNWPDVIRAYNVTENFTPEVRTAEHRRNLRDKCVNSFVYLEDGSIYRGPGGGFMASGMAYKVRRSTDYVIEQIIQTENDVRNNAEKIRAQLRIANTDSLQLHLLFTQDLAHELYHKRRKTIIRFNVENRPKT